MINPYKTIPAAAEVHRFPLRQVWIAVDALNRFWM
jgi:hypothetical protein